MTLEALGASVVALSVLVFSVSGYHQFPTSVQFTQNNNKSVFTLRTYTHVHTCTHTCTHKCTQHAHKYTHTHTHRHTDRHTDTHTHTYVHTYTHMYTVHTHTHTYTHIRTHTHTHSIGPTWDIGYINYIFNISYIHPLKKQFSD